VDRVFEAIMTFLSDLCFIAATLESGGGLTGGVYSLIFQDKTQDLTLICSVWQ
jgi:hypothetical protein